MERNLRNGSWGKYLLEILAVSTRLGLTSFGGPAAHLAYFHDEYVKRRKWLDERSYADLIALCQFLPGPASSQAGIGIGIMRAGLLGGLLAFIGFTLPSVLIMASFALVMEGLDVSRAGWIHGLKLVAVAIVAQAVWGMGQKLAPDRSRATVAIGAAAAVLLWQTPVSQIAVIMAAALLGWLFYKEARPSELPYTTVPVSKTTAAVCLSLFFGLLVLLPAAAEITGSKWLELYDIFYRSGSLVFGGGHVVLPLLERELVPSGVVSGEAFLAGYGAAQAVPGPLFTFASYLGAIAGGWQGAIVATAAIFTPAFLLVVGALPFWDCLRRVPSIQGVLHGVNAAVVGILLAALYDPIWTSSVASPADFALAAVLFIGLVFWKLPPWIIVAAGTISGSLITVYL
ncbi:chromate transporter [Paenibacillus pasadenensis]|uniref:chromate transporter n=1 Tax=Paenibacillus pasadenensis TaxID=217090 RepID=UPI00203A677D|nr:chromate transporter [Paenibacillus pasadenensis]MCM3749821.1 chromate transporter [Paenibacillus pasadenensis]